jgi:hypothetical protein
MRSRIEALVVAFIGALCYALLAGSLAQAAYVPVVSGTIVFFNRTVATGCPTGYTEFTALRGRYPVGVLAAAASAGLTAGTAFTASQEDRPVGAHGHPGSTISVTLNDPGHIHNGRTSAAPGAGFSRPNGGFLSADSTNGSGGDNFTTSNTTGITVSSATTTIASAGAVASTNAPYIQLLACSKS